MPIEVHSEAAKSFDCKAEGLLPKLTPHPRPSRRRVAGGFRPDTHVSAVIPQEDIIGEVQATSQIVDQDGTEVGRYFEHGQGMVGLVGDSFSELVRLAEAMGKTPALRDTASTGFLIDSIFAWMQGKLAGSVESGMTKYVLARCEEQIQEVELWLPIAWLNIESDIRLGRTTFRTISRRMLDEWQARIPAFEDAETQARVEHALERERHQLLGFAAAVVQTRAEPQKASEVAFAEAERAVSLLRFFSPANFSTRRVSYCTLMGRELLGGYECLTVKEGKIVLHESGALERNEPSWRISNAKLAEIGGALGVLGGLLEPEKQTEFQGAVLDALLLYSKSSLAKEYADKLVYILVALESLLLKDSNEPIQKSLGERMAVLVGRTVDERLAVIKNVTDTYRLRSQFIHHGQSIGIDDVQTLQTFMVNTWQCLYGIAVGNSTRFDSKPKFLDALERVRLSGGAAA